MKIHIRKFKIGYYVYFNSNPLAFPLNFRSLKTLEEVKEFQLKFLGE